jgi:hypothetical protein
MWLISVLPSSRKDKKLVAEFCPCAKKEACRGKDYKKVHFGLKGSTTFTEGATEQTKNAYLKRHAPNENWNNPTSAGALSRWLLWEKKSLQDAIKNFKLKFNL